MKLLRLNSVVFVALALTAADRALAGGQFGETQAKIPVAKVSKGDLELKVYATGELRPVRSMMLIAPPVGGGTLRIIHLTRSGSRVNGGDVVIEFDPSEQQYNLEQSRSDLLQAEQEIAKAKADAEVQTSQDKVALLKAQFAVRQADLDVSKNELLSAIDAKKNLLALAEAHRALAQLEQDIKSHAASNRATIAVAEEKRNKAKLAMDEAQRSIESMRVRAPIGGMVEVRKNQEASGGFFFGGMTLPDYREGDEVNPGSYIAQVLETNQMELEAKLDESDRTNVRVGEAVEVHVDALPGAAFKGKVKTLPGATSGDMWGGNATRTFDATFELDKPAAELRPGFTAHLVILGSDIKGVLCLPRQAIFEKGGKPIVYVKSGSAFQSRDVEIKYQTESRVAVEGLPEGTEVALVNPEQAMKKSQKAATPLAPAEGVGSR
ncbi:MAG: multidrug transporter [Acidobacteria bacterium]|nr:MAG: multidrug transporter [Acidobacteriota bacterium]